MLKAQECAAVGCWPPQYAPPSPPPWAPKRLPPPSRQQRSSSSPRPTRSHALRCSHLTCQPGSEQSSPVTLTFWPWKWYLSHVWCGLPVCQLCVFLGLSVLDLGLMYSTDRQTDRCQTDVRQKPIRGSGIIMQLWNAVVHVRHLCWRKVFLVSVNSTIFHVHARLIKENDP